MNGFVTNWVTVLPLSMYYHQKWAATSFSVNVTVTFLLLTTLGQHFSGDKCQAFLSIIAVVILKIGTIKQNKDFKTVAVRLPSKLV